MGSSAKHPGRAVARERPPGLDDATVEALGLLSEALETVEVARGHLYEFHRLSGGADHTLKDAVTKLRAAGHRKWAALVEDRLVGRDVIPGMWTFEVVEAYDQQYWTEFRAIESQLREHLAAGTRHIYEAEMKQTEQRAAGS